MMNDYDSQYFRQFIADNSDANPSELRLKYHINDGKTDYAFAITQIECRRKYARKLHDTLSRTDNFLFGSELSGEQCTSDNIAELHADIIDATGCTVVDFTAGLGIDAMHIARKAVGVTAVERQPLLAELLRHNAYTLRIDNIDVKCGDCTKLLADGELHGDIAFVDPARRAADGSRVFALEQCLPSVTDMADGFRSNFKTLYIKMSPMLDIARTISELGDGITDIYAIGTQTECLELFARQELRETDHGKTHIHSVTVTSEHEYNEMTFEPDDERNAPAPQTDTPRVGDYIYEPHPAVTKAGAFKLFAHRYALKKIQNNTHIYFSEKFCPEADANIRKVTDIIPWQSKNIKRLKSRFPRLDIAVRNFGMSAEALRAKLGVKPATSPRLLGVTDCNGKRLLLILDEKL